MLVNIQNIEKSFGTRAENTHRSVLNQLSLNIGDGESVAILGPSGSGKTTLLNIIGSIEKADKGNVLFRDKNINDLSKAELEKFRNREIGFVFQFHHLLPQCTLLENILIPTLMIKNKEENKQKIIFAEHLLKRVKIWDHRNKLPSKMSGGECQRAAVIRAMINQPSLLLADEPTGALDSSNADSIAELLLDFNKNDKLALLLVTHSMELAKKMDKSYRLIKGKLERI